MMNTLTKGAVVKFKKPLNTEKAETRMIIISDSGGGRVLVRDVSDKGILNSLYSDELELCEKWLHAQQQ